ncbi:hypothetical protein L5G28_15245 [Gordonia sp. HY285]|uniref:hypothetical protein n=1 Tax=Gordonia liuliyuniae TaxID=2911517 RepID=UPI001F36B211|nr:hypothetical protein [Gordonia liuliyuniae]MCF8611502.1 hypothetical protein [Gordonia liuliyuniae]
MTVNSTPASPVRRAVRRVCLGLATSILALFFIGAAGVAAVVAASPPRVGPVVSDVDRAVADLVGSTPADALAHLPAGFESTMGYRPVLEDSRPVNPTGSCSSPVPLPERFEPACRAHDFGYDLLRFGEKTGRPVAQWARRALDGMLVDAMHDSCTNPLCDVAAAVADGGLTANSWRQDWRTPTPESTGDMMSTTTLRVVEAIGTRR